jgi:hypothetical protein
MRRRLLGADIVVVWFLAAAGVCACGTVNPDGGVVRGNPAVELGVGDLQFQRPVPVAGPGGGVVVDKVVPLPFQSWSWRLSGLEGLFDDVPAHPFGDPNNPITASYQSTIANLLHQQETLLFAQNPEEEYQILAATGVDQLGNFRALLDRDHRPEAFTRVYPPLQVGPQVSRCPFSGVQYHSIRNTSGTAAHRVDRLIRPPSPTAVAALNLRKLHSTASAPESSR